MYIVQVFTIKDKMNCLSEKSSNNIPSLTNIKHDI